MPPQSIPQHSTLRSKKRRIYAQIGYEDLAVAKKCSPAAFTVYTYLSIRTGLNDNAYPSLRTMADDLGMAVSTIQRAVAALIEFGVLVKDPGGPKSSNHYFLLDPPSEGVSEMSTPVSIMSTPSVSEMSTPVSEMSTEEDSGRRFNSEEDSGRKEPTPKNEPPAAVTELVKATQRETPVTISNRLVDWLVKETGAPFPRREKAKEIDAVKQLLEVGATEDDIQTCLTYLLYIEPYWKDREPTFATLAGGQYRKWVRLGRPTQAPQTKAEEKHDAAMESVRSWLQKRQEGNR